MKTRYCEWADVNLCEPPSCRRPPKECGRCICSTLDRILTEGMGFTQGGTIETPGDVVLSAGAGPIAGRISIRRRYCRGDVRITTGPRTIAIYRIAVSQNRKREVKGMAVFATKEFTPTQLTDAIREQETGNE